MTLPSIIAECNPPEGTGPTGARAFLELVQERGKPCFRCLANDAEPGEAPRCHFLARGFRTRLADHAAAPDGSFGL